MIWEGHGPVPCNCKSFQSVALHAPSVDKGVSSLVYEMHEKAKVTLQPIAPLSRPRT